MKRIFMAIPVYQYPSPECIESVINAVSVTKNRFDVTVKLISGYAVDQARTKAVEVFMASDSDYLMFVDSDIILPGDVIDKFVEADKDAVTGIYHYKSLQVPNSVVYRVENNQFKAIPTAEIKPELFKVTACGFGCILMSRKLVRKVWEQTNHVPFKFIQGKLDVSEDIYFCNEMEKAGFELWADGSVVCGHVGKFMF